ncbi:heparan sulfate glucosamine 3-O-sulfotransferase 1-like [Saccoglossus kowalevskii]
MLTVRHISHVQHCTQSLIDLKRSCSETAVVCTANSSSVHSAEVIIGDNVTRSIQLRDVSLVAEETEQSTWDASYDEAKYIEAKFGSFCYSPKYPYFVATDKQLLSESVLRERGCAKRLPKVIIAGVKKCGTGAVLRFLNLHPNITGSSQAEVHYFDSRVKRDLTWYRDQMPYSSQDQITIEKTPTYFNFPDDAPRRIREELSPETKIILVLCDPVRRAVSDYLEYQWRTTVPGAGAAKRIRKTFELTVVDVGYSESVKEEQEIVDLGVYIKFLIRWYDAFEKENILLVDGTRFSNAPYRELQKIEHFLGLRPFFREAHFSLNPDRGIYCINFPKEYCLPESKGRTHPIVDDIIWQKMCDFYAPYDKMLAKIYGYNFSWVGHCEQRKQYR